MISKGRPQVLRGVKNSEKEHYFVMIEKFYFQEFMRRCLYVYFEAN